METYVEKSPLNTVIVRLSGEIPIKSEPVRSHWEKILYKRVKSRVFDLGNVIRERGRIYVYTDQPYEVIKRLQTLFGVSSFSPAAKCDAELEQIKIMAVKVAQYYIRKLMEKGINARTFAIVSKKVLTDKFGTTEIRYDVGAFVKNELGLEVNLDYPDIPINIEVRRGEAYIYVETLKGAGGLPIGVQDRILVLLKGDKDSVTSMWLMLKRGCPVTAVHYALCPDAPYLVELKDIVNNILREWGEGYGRFYIIPLYDLVNTVCEKVPTEAQWLVLRKLMIIIANVLAERENAKGIALGDRELLDTNLFVKVKTMWQRDLVIHFPVLNMSDREVNEIMFTIECRIQKRIRLETDCDIIKKMKREAKTINPNLIEKYVVDLRIDKKYIENLLNETKSVET